ncbi:hypothetical protein CHU92_01385 [Flavobacterium cyanobacteriorum]|uniref:histidine kinase n=1 Tax=Flavobacterium cyanobacteriorum TaxID=2022802 RepID=A0A255ZY76_9FLAO|nr:hypothetical protein CHU92_01385 [Flavobacterium cyanobacteriorum]
MGRTRKEIINKKYTEAMPDLEGSAVVEKLLTVYRTGTSHRFTEIPVMFSRKGKKVIKYFNSVYQPLVENKTITGVIAVVNEVTEQYLAKQVKEKKDEQLKTILETMPHITYHTDACGNVKYYNQRYAEYTGQSIEEAKEGAWKDAIHPDMLEDVQKCWENAMEKGEEYINSFLLKRGYDNTYRWHIARTVPLRDETGTITEWVGTLTDIHEQKIFAQKLEAMVYERTQELNFANLVLERKNMELEQTNKEMESFSYIASHDLQEPLRKIRTFINMIVEKGTGNLDLYLSKIDSSAERMSQLINAVLIYSRLSSGPAYNEHVDLNAVLKQVLIDFELVIEEKNVTIKSGQLPSLNANPLQMSQLFSNLIGNSIKYCKNKPQIIITAKEILGYEIPGYNGSNTGQKYAELRFSDNGIGFEEQHSGQIFKLFQRLHGKTEYSGTGIGLSICKKIVDQHNGFIMAESVPGEGATFVVYLPLG